MNHYSNSLSLTCMSSCSLYLPAAFRTKEDSLPKTSQNHVKLHDFPGVEIHTNPVTQTGIQVMVAEELLAITSCKAK